MKYLLLIAKNLRRNRTRSLLTAAGTMILVLVVSLVWSILSFLDEATTEKSANFKAIVTERWRIPSQMPFAYAESLSDGAARRPGDVRPIDSMTWQFYGGTLDPANKWPVSRVKIDGSLIRNIGVSNRAESQVRAVAQLAADRGIETVAEGVESERIHDKLLTMGIDFAQGFHLAKPQPLATLFGQENGSPPARG